MPKTGTPNNSKQELRLRILETAIGLFKVKGIKSVRMDDIARQLSISKRTLYEMYDNKEQLLYEGIVHENEMTNKKLNDFRKQAHNEMELVLMVLQMKLRELENVSPSFYSELNKYKSVKAFLQESFKENRSQSLSFFTRGVEKGFFREGLNYDILVKMSDAQMNYVMQNRMYEHYPLKDIFVTLVNTQLRGICTEKGLKILERKL